MISNSKCSVKIKIVSSIEWSYAKDHVFNEMKFEETRGDKNDQYIVVCLAVEGASQPQCLLF